MPRAPGCEQRQEGCLRKGYCATYPPTSRHTTDLVVLATQQVQNGTEAPQSKAETIRCWQEVAGHGTHSQGQPTAN
jgi:hypothetical protein